MSWIVLAWTWVEASLSLGLYNTLGQSPSLRLSADNTLELVSAGTWSLLADVNGLRSF